MLFSIMDKTLLPKNFTKYNPPKTSIETPRLPIEAGVAIAKGVDVTAVLVT